jgi:Outer membrane protein beta-barrel domain
MRHRAAFVSVLAAALLAAAPYRAQAQNKPVHVSFGGGFTVPNSEVRDRLGDGYNFNFGVDVAVNPVVSIEGLYSFNGLGQKQISINVSPSPGDPANAVPTNFFSDMNMQYGTGSVIFQKPEGSVRPYGLVGLGVYYRPIKVTTPGIGYVPGYCDPWWYVCVPGGWVPVENVVGDRSSTDFGMDFGGGVRFGPVYAELRYHYIWGPTIGQENSNLPAVNPPPSSSLVGQKANGQFLATTFGVRF